jgi:hypothetical protein
MPSFTFLFALVLAALIQTNLTAEVDYYKVHPFGSETDRQLGADEVATGKWWLSPEGEQPREEKFRDWIRSRPREDVLAFAMYTHENGVLKLTAQCFPLYKYEPKTAVLELFREGAWKTVQERPVVYPGWTLHFRVEDWDNSLDVRYRVRLGELSTFEGLIRKDPVDKKSIVVASMSCNSPSDATRYERSRLVGNLLRHDPDLLFFAGDQNYIHDEPTYGWLMFGVQFGEVMRDRPTICIPDDHDVGHPNLWGECGRKSPGEDFEGGYLYPASFVNMVQRQQSWSLPDAYDPEPVDQGITVYYTDLTLGGISFAILEDRKFKSTWYPDPEAPGKILLGKRQHDFLDTWSRNWTGAHMKVVLSQTPFVAHTSYSGQTTRRIEQDHDTNGWPASGRNEAVRALRRVRATHICGDQHLAAVIQHGIEDFRDGPYSFTSPALVNTIWGRWWWPENERAGSGEPVKSPLPWVGDYTDPFGNPFTMIAYANADQMDNDELKDVQSRPNRADGYSLIRFDVSTGNTTFECWPRFANLDEGDAAQFEGWPVTINTRENDGRTPVAFLPEVDLPVANAVVEVTDETTGELIYCYRVDSRCFKAPVFGPGRYTLRAGADRPDTLLLSGVVIEPQRPQ